MGVLTQVQLLGTSPPLKFGRAKKRAKIGAIYDNFRVWAQISLEPMKIATKSKRRWWERSYLRWTKKFLWNSVHYKQSYRRSCWPTLSRQCAFGVCQCIWVRATWLWNFPSLYSPLNFPQSDLGRRADSRWALSQISSWLLYLGRCHSVTTYFHRNLLQNSQIQLKTVYIWQVYFAYLRAIGLKFLLNSGVLSITAVPADHCLSSY